MAIDFRIGTKILKNLQASLAPATAINPYPYVGVVKNNLDPTRCGRVQVYIPELGGNPDEQANWRTISYASPFMGYTSTEIRTSDIPDTKNAFGDVSHTYGMWMVPPDVGVEVICIFVAGDPMRGYWIACVNSNLSRHMLPGLASSRNVDTSSASANVLASYTTGSSAPVVEFNENTSQNITNPNFYNAPKPVHETQYTVLKNQGLNSDSTRGTISSSSQRETPSHVFGISTPGRPTNDPADDPTYISRLTAGTLTEDYYRVKSRKGGHTFVMDDGSVLGTDQLVRLRTAQGHQILMHDTNQTVYIGHASGNTWVELDSSGSINMYARGNFNLRSENTINLHSDHNINFHAGNNINLFAANSIQIQATTTKLLQANLFSNIGVNVTAITPLTINSLEDAVFNSNTKTWTNVRSLLSSITTAAPTHEPYYRNLASLTSSISSTPTGGSGTGNPLFKVITGNTNHVIDSLTYNSTTGEFTFIPFSVVPDGNTIVINNGVLSATGNSIAIQTNSLLVQDTGLYQPAYIANIASTIVARNAVGNIYATNFIGNLIGTSSTALYADLAEKYLTDKEYPIGTVLTIGGTAEVTACSSGTRALGPVSENPAFRMNEGLSNGTYIALKGRVPCYVVGTISKGDQLIAGNNGCAVNISTADNFIPYPFAMSLDNYDSSTPGIIEVVVL